MECMETIRKIRLAIRDGMGSREAARKFHKSRETIRKIIRTEQTKFIYKRKTQSYPALGQWLPQLEEMLAADVILPRAKRLSALSLYEELQGQGYTGSYSSVRRYIAKWRQENLPPRAVFIPQVFEKGEAFQFDWSTEQVEIGGIKQSISVAHLRLCYSRMSYIACYPRERLEMVMDAHIKACEFFGGLCKRAIYDNLKAVVARIGKGKERVFNSHMLQLSSHYLFDMDACTPGSGWEKGQVERQVQTIRERIFQDRLSFPDFESLQAYVNGRVIGLAKTMEHPEFYGKSIYEVFEEEKEYLVRPASRFEGYVVRSGRASSMGLVNLERNQYSVPCAYAGKEVEIRVYAWRVKVCHEGKVISEHARCFDKKRLILDPFHYLPVLERKPGALRNGRPFRQMKLPPALGQIKDLLLRRSGGDREVAGILCAIPRYGLDAVEVACELALEENVLCKSRILNILSRVSEDVPASNIDYSIGLKNPPLADCSRYDGLRSGHHGA